MSQKPKSIPGMHDLLGDEILYWQKLERVSRHILDAHGYREIRTPMLEETGLFERGIGDGTQVVKKEMYSFLDKGGEPVTLRPEGTAGVVRAYIEHSLGQQQEVNKLWYMGPMFRYERPQKGRLRQFHQIGVEVFGVDSPYADAEVVTLVDRIAKAVGVDSFDVMVNSLGTFEERKPYQTKLQEYFTLRLNDLCKECQERLGKNVLRIFDCKNPTCGEICNEAPVLLDFLSADSKRDFDVFQNALTLSGVRFTVNPRVVRGLDYYEKNTFEFVSDKLGAQSAFCGGGRYNHLVEELGGKASPGVGFGLGCERLVMLMQECAPVSQTTRSGVFVMPLAEAAFPKARGILQNLRDQGVFADSVFVSKSLKAQMRHADRLNCRHVVILGEDELNRGVAQVKNLETGAQQETPLDQVINSLKNN